MCSERNYGVAFDAVAVIVLGRAGPSDDNCTYQVRVGELGEDGISFEKVYENGVLECSFPLPIEYLKRLKQAVEMILVLVEDSAD